MKEEQHFLIDLAETISLPEVYFQVRKLLEMPNPKIEDFEKLIEIDSMLTTRLIRIANSEFFGFGRKTNRLHDAIGIIGVIQLHDVLLSCLAMRIFYTVPGQILNINEFWRHSVKRGIAARSIAKLCDIPAINRFFTLGLLLDIGHAAMYAKAPELAAKALLESKEKNRFLDEVERECFGFDYCQLGAALMRHWRLPEVYPQITAHHLYPERTAIKSHIQADIIHLAHQMLEAPGSLNLRLKKVFAFYFLEELTVPDNIEDSILSEITKYVDEVFAILCPPDIVNGISNQLDIR